MLQNTKIVRGKHMTVPGVATFYGKNVTFVKSSSWTALETLCRPSFEELALGRNGLEKSRKNVLDISCTLWRWFLKPRDLKKIDHNCKTLSTRFYRFNSRQYVTLYTKYFFWHVDRITSYQSSFAVKPLKNQKIFLFQQGTMNSCRLPKLSNKISSSLIPFKLHCGRFECTYQIKSSHPNLSKFQRKIFRVRIHCRKRSWFPNMVKLFYCKLFSLPCLLPFSCVIPNLSDHIASKNIGNII